MSATEVTRMAQALAAERHWPVFPVNARKSPTCPNGFKDATTDPNIIAALWRRWTAPLIGVATGTPSGISVLDLDTYKPGPGRWLAENNHRLPKTLSFETRQGGHHLYYRHHVGLRSSTGQLAPGVDVRADGGYIVWWHATGLPCLDRREPTRWPEWCVPKPWPVLPARQTTDQSCSGDRVEAYIARLLANISAAPDGSKHDTLLRCSRAIGGVITSAGISADLAHQRISDALALNPSRVANWLGAYRTISDGLADGMQHPFTLADRPYDRRAAA